MGSREGRSYKRVLLPRRDSQHPKHKENKVSDSTPLGCYEHQDFQGVDVSHWRLEGCLNSTDGFFLSTMIAPAKSSI